MKSFSIILSLTLWACCTTLSQQTSLREIASATQTQGMPFVGIDGMTIRESHVYLVDRVMHRIAVLSTKDLSPRMNFSRSANPDASLFLPGFVAVTTKNIFIADFAKNSVRVFSHKFEYINTIRVSGGIFGIAADAEENIWIACATGASRQTLKRIDLSGTVTSELPLKHGSGNQMELYFSFCIDRDNYFYVAYYTKNVIEVLHPSRGTIREFSVPCLPASVPWSKMSNGLFTKDIVFPDGIIFASITTDDNGRLYILSGDYSETPFREIEICSTDGKYLSWCVLNEKSHLIHAGGKNRLVSVEGNKNKVKLYELTHTPHR